MEKWQTKWQMQKSFYRRNNNWYYFIYEGDVVNNVFEGKGKLEIVNNPNYESNFYESDVIVGEFKNNNANGYAESYSKKTGRKYEGYWKGGLYNGKGKIIYANKNWKEGTFLNGDFAEGDYLFRDEAGKYTQKTKLIKGMFFGEAEEVYDNGYKVTYKFKKDETINTKTFKYFDNNGNSIKQSEFKYPRTLPFFLRYNCNTIQCDINNLHADIEAMAMQCKVFYEMRKNNMLYVNDYFCNYNPDGFVPPNKKHQTTNFAFKESFQNAFKYAVNSRT